jgi:hypothetical protein
MRLGSEPIDDTDSLAPQEDSLWDLRSESISALGEYDLREFPTSLRLSDDHSETRTDAPILVDREEYPIDRLECFYYIGTEVLFLETFYSALEFCLLVVVDDDPELIGSGLRLRELETLDMSWMDRIGIHRCDSKSGHSCYIL